DAAEHAGVRVDGLVALLGGDVALAAVDGDLDVVLVAEVLADRQPDGTLDGGEDHLRRDAPFALERLDGAEQLRTLPGLVVFDGAHGLVSRPSRGLKQQKKVGAVPLGARPGWWPRDRKGCWATRRCRPAARAERTRPRPARGRVSTVLLVRDSDIVARTALRSKGKLGGKGDILFPCYRHRGRAVNTRL